MSRQTGLYNALRVATVQAAIIVLVSLTWVWGGAHAMASSLLGGFVFIVPNVYFAYRFFSSKDAKEPHQIVRAFYQGELFKLVIMVALSIAIFVWLSVLLVPFITGLAGAIFGVWFAPFAIKSDKKAAVVL